MSNLTNFAIAPMDLTTADDFEVRKFTTGTTHAANAIPNKWTRGNGCYVELISTVDVHFAFSKNSTAEIDQSVAGTAAGASDTVGMLLPANERLQIWVTGTGYDETMYFVRESASAGDVYVRVCSSPRGY